MDFDGYFANTGLDVGDVHLNIFEETSFRPNHLSNQYEIKKRVMHYQALRQSEYARVPLYREETEVYMRLASCFKVGNILLGDYLTETIGIAIILMTISVLRMNKTEE